MMLKNLETLNLAAWQLPVRCKSFLNEAEKKIEINYFARTGFITVLLTVLPKIFFKNHELTYILLQKFV